MGVRYGQWRPLANDWASQGRMARHDIICLHTMVGSLWGTDAYFRQGGYGGTESHWGVGGDGEVLQWQDTDYRAEANLNGNHRIISIETADHGPEFPKWDTRGDNVPPWTGAQIEAMAQIIARCCAEYDIPCALIPDSLPGRRGIGYHRQGCKPHVVAGGELWSSASGKVCPGNRRIAQIPKIIARARQILGGASPAPEDDDMAWLDQEARKLANGRSVTWRELLLAIDDNLSTIRDKTPTATAKAVWEYPVSRPGATPMAAGPLLGYADAAASAARDAASKSDAPVDETPESPAV